MAEFDSTKTYLIQGLSLKRLADIVRQKIGKNVPMTLEQMGNYIYSLRSDAMIPTDGILITGDASNLFANDLGDGFIEAAGDRLYTENLTNVSFMFEGSRNLTSFPFVLNALGPLHAAGIFKDCTSLLNVDENLKGIQGLIQIMEYGFYNCESLESIAGLKFDNSNAYSYRYMFANCYNLKEIGYLENMRPNNMQNFMFKCNSLREFPLMINFRAEDLQSANNTDAEVGSMFFECYSLRSIPEDFLKKVYNAGTTKYTNTHLYNLFTDCYALDEIRGLNPLTATMKSNMFKYSFDNCNRAKELIFATQEDGTPYEVEWSGQTIDLSGQTAETEFGYVYLGSVKNITNYNSGITTDKKVSNASTYAALKNDPDWYTDQWLFARYNHDSAVNTINSLPDTSAYLASVNTGSSSNTYRNTIKFRASQGRDTDGGKIGNLTPEEIAVATAKGWTVTLTSN